MVSLLLLFFVLFNEDNKIQYTNIDTSYSGQSRKVKNPLSQIIFP